MRNLKLIWDFKGPDSKKIAEHHLIHLNEYAAMKDIKFIATGTEEISKMHSIAYAAINEEKMPQVRDDLKPHRGQLWTKELD